MNAQLHFGDTDGLAVVAVYEFPVTTGVTGRWVKIYPTRGDACWDVERLSLVAPETVAILRTLPANQEIPVLSAYVRDVKDTMRSFTFFPFTQAQ